MRPARAILLYAVAVIVLGAVLAPFVFDLVQWLAAHVAAAHPLARHPFKRILSRTLLVVALAGLWPLWRALGFRRWAEIGFSRDRRWWRTVLAGFALGVGSLALAAGLALLSGGRHLDPAGAASAPAALVARLLLTAVVVAVIEETFFRGGLQAALARGLRFPVAWLLASLIYAALHFLKPKGPKLAAADVDWLSGWRALGTIVSRSLAAPDVAVAFISLFLVGLILGWAFKRTGALYLSIGLHAGWVLANELVRAWGGGRLVEDPLVWPVLLATWAVAAAIWRDRCSAPVS